MCAALGTPARGGIVTDPGGFRIGRYGNRNHSALLELPAVASATGRPPSAVRVPASATEDSPGRLRPTAGTTRRGAEGLLDLLQAPILRHRQAAQAATAGGPGQAPHRWTTRTPQTRAGLVPTGTGQRRIARLRPGPLPQLRTRPTTHRRRSARRPADRDP